MISKSFCFRLGFEAPANYNLSDFYIQTLAVLPHDKETSLERIEVSLMEEDESIYSKVNCAFYISIFVMNMNNHLSMLNTLVKFNNIMILTMMNPVHLVEYLIVQKSLCYKQGNI